MNNDILEVAYRAHGRDGKQNKPHHENCVEIFQMWSSDGFFVVKNSVFSIEEGSVFFINATESHYSSVNAENYLRNKIIVSNEYFRALAHVLGLEKYAKRYLYDNGGYKIEMNPRSEAAIHVDKLFLDAQRHFSKLDTDDLSVYRFTMTLIEMLKTIFSFSEEVLDEEQHLPETSSHSVLLLCDYINKNQSTYENMTLDKICAQLHFSPSYASHLFKQITNKSVTQFITERRISEAKRLLRTTNMRVVEISDKLGFHNSTIFCKTFKKVANCTPLEYRAQNE